VTVPSRMGTGGLRPGIEVEDRQFALSYSATCIQLVNRTGIYGMASE
jgi:hypothetical protein